MYPIFNYDGRITDDGMTAQGQLHYLTHPEMGLMWCSSDLTRLLVVDRGASTLKIRAYAPSYSITEPIPGHKTATFTAHRVMMDWMDANLPQWAATRKLLDDWVKEQRFAVTSKAE